MKLTRLAPAVLTALLVTGSAAFSQTVRFGYDVSGGAPVMGGSVLSQPAVIDTSLPTLPGVSSGPMVLDNGACGTCGVLTQPAVVNSCGSCSSGVLTQPAVLAPVQPTVINQPLFIQGTNPYDINLTSNPVPACGTAVMQQSAVVEQPAPAPQPLTAIEKTTIHTVKTTTFRQIRRAYHHRRVVKCVKHKRHSCKRVIRKHSCSRRILK